MCSYYLKLRKYDRQLEGEVKGVSNGEKGRSKSSQAKYLSLRNDPDVTDGRGGERKKGVGVCMLAHACVCCCFF